METYYYGHQSSLIGCLSEYSRSTNIFAFIFDLDFDCQSPASYDREQYTRKKSRSRVSWFKRYHTQADRETDTTDRITFLTNTVGNVA